MDADQVVFLGWTLSIFFTAICIFQTGLIILKRGIPIVMKTISGYFLISIWSFAALTVATFIPPEERVIPIILVVILFIISTQQIIIANSFIKGDTGFIVRLMLALGLIGLGLLFAQGIYPTISFVSIVESEGFYYSKIQSVLLLILTARGLFLFYLFGFVITKIFTDWRIRSSRPFLYAAASLGIVSFTIIFVHFLLVPLIDNLMINTLIFVSVRLLVILAIVLLNIGVLMNTRYVLATLRGISETFFSNILKFAIYTYDLHGPQVRFSHGFENGHSDEDIVFIRLLTLGMAGLSILGRGDDHVEGSAIIPVVDGESQEGLIVSKWVGNGDTKTFLSILIVVDPQRLWLIQDRSIWEFALNNYLESAKDISEVDFEELFTFIKELMVDISINLV